MIEMVLLGAIMCLAGCWFLRKAKAMPIPKAPVKEIDSYTIAQVIARKGRKS